MLRVGLSDLAVTAKRSCVPASISAQWCRRLSAVVRAMGGAEALKEVKSTKARSQLKLSSTCSFRLYTFGTCGAPLALLADYTLCCEVTVL